MNTYKIEKIIEIIIIMKKYPGPNALDITYPNKRKTIKIIEIKKKDLVLFLEIWSLKSIL